MMGDRDYRQLIKNAIKSIGSEIEPKIDPKDINTINVHEVVRCLRLCSPNLVITSSEPPSATKSHSNP